MMACKQNANVGGVFDASPRVHAAVVGAGPLLQVRPTGAAGGDRAARSAARWGLTSNGALRCEQVRGLTSAGKGLIIEDSMKAGLQKLMCSVALGCYCLAGPLEWDEPAPPSCMRAAGTVAAVCVDASYHADSTVVTTVPSEPDAPIPNCLKDPTIDTGSPVREAQAAAPFTLPFLLCGESLLLEHVWTTPCCPAPCDMPLSLAACSLRTVILQV